MSYCELGVWVGGWVGRWLVGWLGGWVGKTYLLLGDAELEDFSHAAVHVAAHVGDDGLAAFCRERVGGWVRWEGGRDVEERHIYAAAPCRE